MKYTIYTIIFILFMLSFVSPSEKCVWLKFLALESVKKINLQFSFVSMGSQNTLVSRQIKSTDKNQ